MLPMVPRFTIERVRKSLDTSFPTAHAAVTVLQDLGIVTEVTGQKKNRSYSYQPYVELPTRWLCSHLYCVPAARAGRRRLAISAATAAHAASNAPGVKPAPEGSQSPVRPLASV